MQVGKFYEFTHESQSYFRDGQRKTIPPQTVLFRVDAVTDRTVDITFENGASNKFGIGSRMHRDCVPSARLFEMTDDMREFAHAMRPENVIVHF